MKSPLLVLASCFALGIVVAHGWPFAGPLAVLLAAAFCLLAGLSFLRMRQAGISGVFALAGFVLAGMAAAGVFQYRFPSNHIHNLNTWNLDLNQDLIIEGVIVSVPVRAGPGFSFDLDCRRVGKEKPIRTVQGKVRIRLFTPPDRKSWRALDDLHLHYGEGIQAPVRLRKPTVYRNPGNFNYRWWLESIEDISWEGTIKNPMSIRRISGLQVSKFSMLAANVRTFLLRGIDALYPPWSAEGNVGAVLKATLLGDRSSLDSATVENFRHSGLYHLLVISGLHVGLLAAVVLFFLKLLRLGNSWRAVFLLLFLGAYNLLVEQRAPTLRASLMIAAYLSARYLYRDKDALNAVGLAALLLLVYKPAWLFEAGFELSFWAALLIAGIVLPILERTTSPYQMAFSQLDNVERDDNLPPLTAQFRLDLRSLIKWSKKQYPFLARHPTLAELEVALPARIGLWTLELIMFSAILQVGLLMPMAETFHRITLVGIGLNALAVPLMTVLVGLAVPTVLLSALAPAVAVVPGKLLFWVTNALLSLTAFHHLPPWLTFRIPPPPNWVALCFALALIGIAWNLGRSRQGLAISLSVFALFAMIVIIYPFSPRLPKGRLEVTALDCGQGESLFAVLPDGTTVLMDAGGRERFGPGTGRWNPGEDIVSSYLWSRRIRKIDIAILGSANTENIKAIDAVLRNFKVGELWRGPRVANPVREDMINTARERGVVVREISKGDEETRGQTTIQVLWPPLVSGDSKSSPSDDDPVLRIVSDRGRIFWRGNTGDRATRVLAELPFPLSSEVLALARPLADSPIQSSFLENLNPKVVIISGGRNYGSAGRSFPVYQKLSAAGVQVFRTLTHGAVTVDNDGTHLTVRCYQGPRYSN